MLPTESVHSFQFKLYLRMASQLNSINDMADAKDGKPSTSKTSSTKPKAKPRAGSKAVASDSEASKA